MEREEFTGYPSIDRPWLKYYSLKAIDAPMPECTMYEYLVQNSSACPQNIAISFFGSKVTYQKLLKKSGIRQVLSLHWGLSQVILLQ